MLKIEDLEYSDIPNIIVEPQDQLFNEFGNNTYNFIDLISELIDNSISAKIDGKILQIKLEIGISAEQPEDSFSIIKDNGKGISRENIGLAISPAGTSGGKFLNEHGLGMKQAVAALGHFYYLATKTENDSDTIIIDKFKFGELFPKLDNLPWEHGTEICVNKLKPIVPKTSQTFTKTINTYLGARYRRYLKQENPMISINVKLLDLDDVDSSGNVTVINEWEVEELKQIYFHPNKRQNMPVVLNEEFKGVGWEADFSFGYAPTNSEYEEMGLEPPKQYEPYHVSLSKQGFDVFKNDRVIQFHQLAELGFIPARHNKYNNVRGEINLRKGFTTAITKNYIVVDENFHQLMVEIKEFLDDGKYLEKKTYPNELPEKLLRDRLKKHFLTRTIDPKTDVKTEYAVGGLGGFIDIFADDEAHELKTIEAGGLDVYQLFAYMDMGDIEKGYLIAPGFKTGAEAAKDFIKKNHDKAILLVNLDEFPIMNAPTPEELKKYY